MPVTFLSPFYLVLSLSAAPFPGRFSLTAYTLVSLPLSSTLLPVTSQAPRTSTQARLHYLPPAKAPQVHGTRVPTPLSVPSHLTSLLPPLSSAPWADSLNTLGSPGTDFG